MKSKFEIILILILLLIFGLHIPFYKMGETLIEVWEKVSFVCLCALGFVLGYSFIRKNNKIPTSTLFKKIAARYLLFLSY